MERMFATEKLGGSSRSLYRFHAVTVLAGICLVLWYRATLNVASMFYKFSQICGTKTKNDT